MISSFEELYEYVSAVPIDDIISEYVGRYDQEAMYLSYRDARFGYLKHKRALFELLWHKYLVRSGSLGRIIDFFLPGRFPEGYFGGRPFECVFKMMAPAPYGENGKPSFSDAIQEIKQNIEAYKEIYESLTDEFSKKTLYIFLLARLSRDPSLFIKEGIYVSHIPPCFDREIYDLERPVYVDCGGYNGDTVKKFIKVFPSYQRVYVYEPDPLLDKTIRKNLSGLRDIEIRIKGVSDTSSNKTFSVDGGGTGRLSDEGTTGSVAITTIDEDVNEKISLIKMDIEGEETKALNGAIMHLRSESPVLAINIYHRLTDLLDCYRIINGANSQYKFYLRHYGHGYFKTVLYAKVV